MAPRRIRLRPMTPMARSTCLLALKKAVAAASRCSAARSNLPRSRLLPGLGHWPGPVSFGRSGSETKGEFRAPMLIAARTATKNNNEADSGLLFVAIEFLDLHHLDTKT